MGTIYLTNILRTILLYSKYIPFNVTIILRPFMMIIIFEDAYNMVVLYTFKIYIYKYFTPNYII
jgi:hypothetical protein